MKNKFGLVLALFGLVIIFGLILINWEKSPVISKVTTPQPNSTPTPVVFKYDQNTDLKKELNQVNPKINDEDFQPLQEIIDYL